MVDEEWIEVAVFIHGITPDRDTAQKFDDPEALYDIMLKKVQRELENSGKKPLDDVIKVLWNWTLADTAPKFEDQKLARAERLLGDWMNEREKQISKVNWLHFILWKMFYKIGRDIMLYGLADAMYYVSQDGEKTVREHIFTELCYQIMQRLNAGDGRSAKISLTVFGHSAGSLIAHDFLYQLFSNRERKSTDVQEIYDLRRLAGEAERQGDTTQPYPRLRVRRLYTFGSPLAAWFIRANSLLNKIIDGKQLKVTDLGLIAEDDLSNPRWVNFWALTDVAAFPLSYLYDNQIVVEDRYVNVGLLFPKTHGAYWSSSKVAKEIADTF